MDVWLVVFFFFEVTRDSVIFMSSDYAICLGVCML